MEIINLSINYRARSKLPSITSIPNPVPNIVGHLVPTTGNDGSAVKVGAVVITGHVQSVSDKHWVFLQFPLVAPFVM